VVVYHKGNAYTVSLSISCFLHYQALSLCAMVRLEAAFLPTGSVPAAGVDCLRAAFVLSEALGARSRWNDPASSGEAPLP
jgi:hypothetical protein